MNYRACVLLLCAFSFSKCAGESIERIYIHDPGRPGHEGFMGWMSKYETTNAQYCDFLNEALATGDIIFSNETVYGAHGTNPGEDYIVMYYRLYGGGSNADGATYGGASRINYTNGVFSVDSGFENHPVTQISWYGATAFCNYYGYRLPTEWEWRAVADYDGSYIYACGNTLDYSKANYMGAVHPDGTTPVGFYGPVGYGLCDMAGNVSEMTSPMAGEHKSYQELGGGWNTGTSYCLVDHRHDNQSDNVSFRMGFRVCKSEPYFDGKCNVYGVFIGVKDFLDANNSIYMRGDLDAQDMFDAFKGHFSNFKEGKLLIADLTSVNSEGITIRDVNEAIKSLFIDSDDILVVYVSGYGGWTGTNDEDTLTEGDEYIKTENEKYIDDDDLTLLLKKVPCQKWVILSASQSGGFWGNDKEKEGRDLDSLSNIGLLGAAPENQTSYYYQERSIFTKDLLSGLTYDIFPHLAADYDWNGLISWEELTAFIKHDPCSQINQGTVVQDGSQGHDAVWSNDMWSPMAFKSNDFTTLSLVVDANDNNVILIENFVKQFQTDVNRPDDNQGFLSYLEKRGSLSGIDSNDIFYTPPGAASSKIVSLIPVKNTKGEIIGYNRLSKDVRPFHADPLSSEVLLELSIYSPGSNNLSINSLNYMRFWIPNSAFKGKSLTIQQISDDQKIEYPVWNIRNIIFTNNGILPLKYLITDSNAAPRDPNIAVQIIKPNVSYAWFNFSTSREIIDIDDNSIVDLNDYALLTAALGKKGILRSDIASLKNNEIISGIPDGIVDDIDELTFIIEYNKKHPGNQIAVPEGFESGQIQEPFTAYGDLPWIINNESYKGNYCVKSGNITDSQRSILEENIDLPGGKIRFMRKVSSESYFDFLIFYIDDVERGRWSGTLDWEEVNFETDPGIHNLKWIYEKDSSGSTGSDAAWIDNIVIK